MVAYYFSFSDCNPSPCRIRLWSWCISNHPTLPRLSRCDRMLHTTGKWLTYAACEAAAEYKCPLRQLTAAAAANVYSEMQSRLLSQTRFVSRLDSVSITLTRISTAKHISSKLYRNMNYYKTSVTDERTWDRIRILVNCLIEFHYNLVDISYHFCPHQPQILTKYDRFW